MGRSIKNKKTGNMTKYETRRSKKVIKKKVISGVLLVLLNINLMGEVVPDPVSIGKGARGTKTATGVDQLDIVAPNKKGISHNKLKELQVDENGLILNNNYYVITKTEIGGLIVRNRNLDEGKQASMIITEVTGNNKTNIKGYIEVAGKKADVLMANRNGINVNGGGFINAGKATLTTGTINMENDDIKNIDVTTGKVSIGNKGIDIGRQDKFEIISKSIEVNGVIKGNENANIVLSAGDQTYEYKTKKVTGKGVSTQGIAIDAGNLGSMYAGKIDIISNDKGAGVNLKGDLLGTDEINISSNGDILTEGKVETNHKATYTAANTTKISNEVKTGKKLEITSKKIDIDGKVVSGYLSEDNKNVNIDLKGNNIKIAGDMQSTGSINATGKDKIINKGNIYASKTIDLEGTTIENSGALLSDSINVKGNVFDNDNGTTQSEILKLEIDEIHNNKGSMWVNYDFAFNGNKLENIGGVLGSNNNVYINSSYFNNDKGTITGKNLNIENKIGSNKEGSVYTDGYLTLKTDNFNGKKGVVIGNKIDIKGYTFDNSEGQLSSKGNIDLLVDNIINNEGIITTDKDINIISQSITNIIGNIISENINICSKELVNDGGVVSAEKTIGSAIDDLTNKKGTISSNKIDHIGKTINNTEGTINGDEVKLSVEKNIINNKGIIYGENTNKISTEVLTSIEGQVLSNKELTLNTKEIDNTKGEIIGQVKEIGGDKLVNNEGKILTSEALSLTGKNIENKKGEIYSEQNIKTIGESLDNSAGNIHTSGDIDLQIENIKNIAGYILADGLTKEDVESEEEIEKIAGSDNNNETENETESEISKNETMTEDIRESINIKGESLDNTKGKIKGTGKINLDVKNTNNTEGAILGEQININGYNFDNSNGQLLAASIVAQITDKLDNTKGLIQGKENVQIKADTLENTEGKILTNSKLILDTDKLDNTKGELIGELDELNGSVLVNKSGKILTMKELTINALDVDNTDEGEIYSAKNINISGNNLNNDKGQIHTAKKIIIDTKDVSNKEGYILANGLSVEDVIEKDIDATPDKPEGIIPTPEEGIEGSETEEGSESEAGEGSGAEEGTEESGSGSEEEEGGSSLGSESAGLGPEEGAEVGEIESEIPGTEETETTEGSESETEESRPFRPSISITGETLDNTKGMIRSLDDIEITVDDTTNDEGIILAERIKAEGVNFSNKEGLVQASDLSLSIEKILDNSQKGVLLGNDKLEISGETLKNIGGQVLTNGELILDTSKEIDNTEGEIIGGLKEINVEKLLNNSGKLYSTEDLTVNAEQAENISGVWKSAGDLSINGGILNNTGGEITGAGNLSIATKYINNTSGILQGNNISVNADDLNNTKGTIIANKDVKIDFKNLNNTKGKITGEKLKLEGYSLDNTDGDLYSDYLSILANINNKRGKLTANELVLKGQGLINEEGQIVGDRISANYDNISNLRGSISGRTRIELRNLNNNKYGKVLSDDYIEITNSVTLHNNFGTIETVGADGGIKITTAEGLDNSNGEITSEGDIGIDVKGKMDNSSGKIASKGDIGIDVKGKMDNSNGKITSEGNAVIDVKGNIDNSNGHIYGKNGNFVTTEGVIENVNGSITSNDTVYASGRGTINIDGIQGNKNTTIIGDTILVDGDRYRADDLQIKGNDNVVLNGNISANKLTLESGSDLNIAHTIEGREGLYIDAKNIVNNGIISAGNMLSINANGNFTNNNGINTNAEIYINANNNIDNNSDILSTNNLYILSKNIITNNGSISGNTTTVSGDNGVVNIGSTIKSSTGTNVIAKNGTVSNITTVKEGTNINGIGGLSGTEIDKTGQIISDGSVYVSGNNIENVGGIIGGNTQTYLDAKEDIIDTSITLNYEGKDVYLSASNVFDDNKTWDVVKGITNVSGKIGNGGNTILNAGRDITLINSDIAASNNVIMYAGRYLNSLAVYDTEYRYDYEKKTKRSGLKKKTTVKEWEIDNKYANGTEINAGGNILFNTGSVDENGIEKNNTNKGIFLQGTNLNAGQNIIARSQGNIYTQGTNDEINNTYKKKTKKSFAGFSYGSSSDKTLANSQNYNLTQMYGQAGITYDSNDRLVIEGADIKTDGNLLLRGKNDISLLPGIEKSSYVEEHKKSGISGSFSMTPGSISAGIGYGKSQSKLEQISTDIVKNNISVGGNYYAISENGNYNHVATDLFVNGDMNITAKDINVLDAQSYKKIVKKSSSSYAGIGISVGTPIVNNVTQVYNTAKSFKDANSKEGYINGVFQGANAYFGGTLEGIKNLGTLLTDPLGAAGITGSVNISNSKSSYTSEGSYSVGSNIIVNGNTTLNADNLHIRGSNLAVGGDLTYNIKNDILIEGGKNTFTEKGQSSGYSFGKNIGQGVANIGINKNSNWGNGTYYTNSMVDVNENTCYNVGGDVTLRGANVSTGTITGTMNNLIIESLQDTYSGGSKGINMNIGIGLGKHTDLDKDNKIFISSKPQINSVGMGFSQSDVQKKLTTTPTTFVANNGQVDVKNKVSQIGSLIDGGFTLNAKEYEYQDLKDINKENNIGIDLTWTPRVAEVYKNGKGTGEYIKGVTQATKLSYSSKDYEANVKATIGSKVDIFVDGKRKDIDINRDTNNMIEVVKNEEIKPLHIDLNTEKWMTKVGREETKAEIAQVKESASQIIKGLQKIFSTEEIKQLEKLMMMDKPIELIRDSEGKLVSVGSKIIGDLEIIDETYIKEYEENVNFIDEKIKEGAFDKALSAIGLSNKEIEEIKNGNSGNLYGIEAILNLPSNTRVALYKQLYDINNRYLYEKSDNERFCLLLGANYQFSDTYKEFRDSLRENAVDYMSAFTCVIGGKTIEITDVINNGGKFSKLSAEEKQELFNKLYTGLLENQEEIFSSENYQINIVNTPNLKFNDTKLANAAAGALFERGSSKVPGTVYLSEMKDNEQLKELQFGLNGNNIMGCGMVLIVNLLHESVLGHGMVNMLNISLGMKELSDVTKTFKNQISDDLYMLKNNGSGYVKNSNYMYFTRNDGKKVYYFTEQEENNAYFQSMTAMEELIDKIRIEKKDNKYYEENFEITLYTEMKIARDPKKGLEYISNEILNNKKAYWFQSFTEKYDSINDFFNYNNISKNFFDNINSEVEPW